jgi:hypothetical protein
LVTEPLAVPQLTVTSPLLASGLADRDEGTPGFTATMTDFSVLYALQPFGLHALTR